MAKNRKIASTKTVEDQGRREAHPLRSRGRIREEGRGLGRQSRRLHLAPAMLLPVDYDLGHKFGAEMFLPQVVEARAPAREIIGRPRAARSSGRVRFHSSLPFPSDSRALPSILRITLQMRRIRGTSGRRAFTPRLCPPPVPQKFPGCWRFQADGAARCAGSSIARRSSSRVIGPTRTWLAPSSWASDGYAASVHRSRRGSPPRRSPARPRAPGARRRTRSARPRRRTA